MTISNHNEPAQAVDIPQSAHARAWADTKRFIATPSFWFMELAATALAATALLLLSVSPVMTIITSVAAPILLLLLSGLFTLGRAPLMQRNEARKELTDIRQRLRPRLRVIEPRQSFDRDERLADALIYIKYVRLVVANQSDAVATSCTASLVDMKPKNRDAPITVAGVYKAPDAFVGYTEIPYPISLTWSDNGAGSSAIDRSIAPRGQAQVDVIRYTTSEVNDPAFKSKFNIKEFQLPATEVVFAIRLDSDDCLPYFYVVCYLPNAPVFGPIQALEILDEGTGPPDLEGFREDVPTQLGAAD